jgi:hypothetical protein
MCGGEGAQKTKQIRAKELLHIATGSGLLKEFFVM